MTTPIVFISGFRGFDPYGSELAREEASGRNIPIDLI
jgi:hypothetical protein